MVGHTQARQTRYNKKAPLQGLNSLSFIQRTVVVNLLFCTCERTSTRYYSERITSAVKVFPNFQIPTKTPGIGTPALLVGYTN